MQNYLVLFIFVFVFKLALKVLFILMASSKLFDFDFFFLLSDCDSVLFFSLIILYLYDDHSMGFFGIFFFSLVHAQDIKHPS